MTNPSEAWRYKVLAIPIPASFLGRPKADELQQSLDEAGRDGWELVNIFQYGTMTTPTLIFKRPA
ncbi:MAG: DUF4177 domain-containing protein [Xanthomonadaceae bacterium]|nr:DUF4177 domain-containing protein [Xanthomonadaceae bacterium]MDE1960354.1 DUF4177 domain-containing protein [Xanthomonadaceae bacterium]MDE2083234.1 DUF4177 domain-containing protein [Xanthomonadaceae bacterium]